MPDILALTLLGTASGAVYMLLRIMPFLIQRLALITVDDRPRAKVYDFETYRRQREVLMRLRAANGAGR